MGNKNLPCHLTRKSFLFSLETYRHGHGIRALSKRTRFARGRLLKRPGFRVVPRVTLCKRGFPQKANEQKRKGEERKASKLFQVGK